MAFTVPKGWDKDSDKLFIHNTSVRIQRMDYKGKEGWVLVPIDLDQAVVEFDPTPEGRDKAFEAFAKGALNTKPKKATKVTKKKTKKATATPTPEAEGEEKGEAAEKDKDSAGDNDENEDEGDED